MQEITCLVSKCSVDSYLSFQVSCNHTVGSSRHAKKKRSKSFATSYVRGKTMDPIHYVNQWLQYLPLKSEYIVTVLDNVVRKSQSDILVDTTFLIKFSVFTVVTSYQSRSGGQHLPSRACNGFWASLQQLVQHLQ